MSFYLDAEVRKIVSPIIVKLNDEELFFENGTALSQHCFDTRYVIRSVSSEMNSIVIELSDGVMSPDPSGILHTDAGIAD